VLPVKELPHIDTGGAQTVTVTRVGVEENGPVVKLLPEYDVRVNYQFFAVLLDGRLPFPIPLLATKVLPS
jgi:hypothetical protein